MKAIVYAGSGTGSVKMGMNYYQTHPRFKEIWLEMDAEFMNEFHFSILHVIFQNPTSIEISIDGYQRTLSHSEGVLHINAFEQVAILMYEIAATRALHLEADYYSGHSLGEVASFAILLPELNLYTLLRAVFVNGIRVLDYFALSTYKYQMVSLDLTRTGLTFAQLEEILHCIQKIPNAFIEISNHNIEHRQYALSGYVHTLEQFGRLLDSLSDPSTSSLVSLVPLYVTEEVDKSIEEIDEHKGLMPLSIYIPHHSSRFRELVPQIRESYAEVLSEVTDFSLLHKHICNINGKPMVWSPEFVAEIQMITQTNITIEDMRSLVMVILVHKSCLSVYWSKVQQTLVDLQVTDWIEVSPKKILTRMMERSFPSLVLQSQLV
jgi:fatty acid synthase subunit beta